MAETWTISIADFITCCFTFQVEYVGLMSPQHIAGLYAPHVAMKNYREMKGKTLLQYSLLVPFLEFTEHAQNVPNFPFGCF